MGQDNKPKQETKTEPQKQNKKDFPSGHIKVFKFKGSVQIRNK